VPIPTGGFHVRDDHRRFPAAFWIANSIELFERAAYYGAFITLALFLAHLIHGRVTIFGQSLHPITIMMIVGIAIQGLAECFLSPRYLEFASKQAPKGQEGLYLGYAQTNTFFAWMFGFILSGYLLEAFCPDPRTLPAAVQNQYHAAMAGQGPLPAAYAHAHYLWYVFACIGLTAFVALLIFHRVTSRIDARREA